MIFTQDQLTAIVRNFNSSSLTFFFCGIEVIEKVKEKNPTVIFIEPINVGKDSPILLHCSCAEEFISYLQEQIESANQLVLLSSKKQVQIDY